jgi:hypothetical protein
VSQDVFREATLGFGRIGGQELCRRVRSAIPSGRIAGAPFLVKAALRLRRFLGELGLGLLEQPPQSRERWVLGIPGQGKVDQCQRV